MAIELIRPNTIVAQNIGNGKEIKLSWSVIDLSLIKYFIVEHYNRHNRAWEPYDGYKGIIDPVYNEDNTPTQSVLIDVQSDTGQHSFRVKSISKSGEHSDWGTASVDVIITDIEASSKKSWIKEGLMPKLLNSNAVSIGDGVAYINGIGRHIDKTAIEIPSEASNIYYIYLTDQWTLEYSDEGVEGVSLSIAEVETDANGEIVKLIDTRYFKMIAPEVTHEIVRSLSSATVSNTISWEAISAINIAGYKLYRFDTADEDKVPSDNDFKLIAMLDSNAVSFIDSTNILQDRTYYYVLAPYDWDSNECQHSKVAGATTHYIQKIDPPPAPANPTATIVTVDRDSIHLVISWDKLVGYDIDYYNVYVDGILYAGQIDHENEIAGRVSYTIKTLPVGRKYRIAINATDVYGNRSPYSEIGEVELKDNSVPKAPVLDESNCFSTGDDNSVYVTLAWARPTQNEDGSALSLTNDLAGYRLYRKRGSEYEYVTNIPVELALDNTFTLSMPSVYRYQTMHYVMKSYDNFGNLSTSYSNEVAIALGGVRPESPTISAIYEARDKIDFVNITILNEYDPDIDEYRIYKRVEDELPKMVSRIQNSEEIMNYLDYDVIKGYTYTYHATSVNKFNTESFPSGFKKVSIVDTLPPVIVDILEAKSKTEVVRESGISKNIKNTIFYMMPGTSSSIGVNIYFSKIDEPYAYQFLSFVSNINTTDTEMHYVHDNISLLENGKVYYYKVQSINHSGKATDLDKCETLTLVIGDTTKPDMPIIDEANSKTNISGNVISNTIVWSAVPNAKEYLVYKTFEPELPNSYKLISTQADTSYTDSNVINGVKYTYYVLAKNDLGVLSDVDISKAFSIVAGSLDKPKDVTITNTICTIERDGEVDIANISIEFSSSASSNVKSYEVYVSTNGVEFEIIEVINAESTRNFNYQGNYNKEYWFKVLVVNELGIKSEGTTVKLFTEDSTIPPDIHEISANIQEDGDYHKKVRLSWDHILIDDRLDYIVYEVNNSNGEKIIPIARTADNYYDINNLPNGFTYRYAVKCADRYGNVSKEYCYVDVKTEDNKAPNKVTNLQATPYEMIVKLTWDKCTDYDFSLYRIYNAINQSLIAETTSNEFTDHFETVVERSYYVTAVDVHGNESIASETVSETPNYVNNSSLNPTEPSQVTGLSLDASVPLKVVVRDTGKYEGIVGIKWNEITGQYIKHYNIYINGARYAQSKTTNFTISNLEVNVDYKIQVSAVNNINVEGELSDKITVNLKANDHADLEIEKLKVVPLSVRQYFNGLIIEWENGPEAKPNSISKYILQYVAASSNSIRPTSGWIDIEVSPRNTFFFHSKLDYNKYYYYQIITEDIFGRRTSVATFTGKDGLQPEKIGHGDLYASSLWAENIQANAIKSVHLDAGSVTADKIAAGAITAEKIAAGAITSELLTIKLGGNNYVQNSSFGLSDSSNLYGMNWSKDYQGTPHEIHLNTGDICVIKNDGVVNTDIPVMHHALKITHSTSKTSTFIQKLKLPANVSKLLVSYFIDVKSLQSSHGSPFSIDVYNKVADEVISSDSMAENIDWSRRSFSVDLSDIENKSELYLRFSFNNSIGTVKITGIMVDEADKLSDWKPYDGEIYGASGDVQINSAGLLVTNGRMLLKSTEEDGNSVVISNDGLYAGNADQTAYTKVTKQGLESIGGNFSLSTLNDSVVIDGTGVTASNGDNLVKLGTDGILTVQNGALDFSYSNNNKETTFNKDGFICKDILSNKEMFRLGTDGNFNIAGEFTIGEERIAITQSSITTRNSQNEITFSADAQEGKLKIGSVDIYLGGMDANGQPKSEEGIILNSSGITGKDGNGTKVFELGMNGSSFFRDKITIGNESNGFHITANSLVANNGTGNQLTITKAGISATGSMASLAFDGALRINNDEGIVIAGSKGLHVKNAEDKEIVSIDSSGITISQDKAIVIEGQGTIKFANGTTALTSTSINADAITSGKIAIKDTNSMSGIYLGGDDESSAKTYLTKDGLTLKNTNGDTVIQGGKIFTQHLGITSSSLNLLKNGRGEFITDNIVDSWTVSRQSDPRILSRVSKIPENISMAGSAKYGLEFDNTIVGDYFEQVFEAAYYDKQYTLCMDVYLIAGTVEVEINGLRNEGEEGQKVVFLLKAPDTPKNLWHSITKVMNGVAIEGDHYIRFTAKENNTTCYFTNIYLSEGNIATGYNNYRNEVYVNEAVNISDKGIEIASELEGGEGAKLNISSRNGISYIKDTYEKTSTFKIDKDGFTISTTRKSAELEKLEISSEAIKISKGETPTAIFGYLGEDIFNSHGLYINDGKFYIHSSYSGMTIDQSGISLSHMKNGERVETIKIGQLDGINGIRIIDGAFSLVTNRDGRRIEISDEGINLTEGDKQVLISLASGIIVKGDGMFNISSTYDTDDETQGSASVKGLTINSEGVRVRTGYTNNYNQALYYGLTNEGVVMQSELSPGNFETVKTLYDLKMVRYGKVTLNSNSVTVPIDHFGFKEKPEVILIPSKFTTYLAESGSRDQTLEYEVSWPSESHDEFVIRAFNHVGSSSIRYESISQGLSKTNIDGGSYNNVLVTMFDNTNAQIKHHVSSIDIEFEMYSKGATLFRHEADHIYYKISYRIPNSPIGNTGWRVAAEETTFGLWNATRETLRKERRKITINSDTVPDIENNENAINQLIEFKIEAKIYRKQGSKAPSSESKFIITNITGKTKTATLIDNAKNPIDFNYICIER